MKWSARLAAICLASLLGGCSGGVSPDKPPEGTARSDAAGKPTDPIATPIAPPLTPEQAREFQLRAEKLLGLFSTERIVTYQADFAETREFANIHKTTEILRGLRDGAGAPLTEKKSFQEALAQTWVNALTAVPRRDAALTRDEIVQALGDPEKKEPGEFKQDKQIAGGGTESETMTVDWHHWAWASVAIDKQDKCVALRINAEQWRAAQSR